jgi:putative heme transporter
MTQTGTPTVPASAPQQPAALLRGGWMGVAQLVAIVAVVAGAGVAIYAERAVLRQGLGGLAHTRVSRVLAGAAAEFGSMAAFGQLERVLLRAAGARLALRSVLATAYNANAISISVPVVGSGIAATYAFREFRRGGAGAASLSPVPGGIGIVDIVLIAAFAGVGIHAPAAVTVTLLYRLLSFKIGMSAAWCGYNSWRRRRSAA